MKTKIIILTLILLSAGILSYFYINSNNKKTPQTTNTTKNIEIKQVEVENKVVEDNKNIFTFIKDSGVVMYKIPGSSEFVLLSVGETTFAFNTVIKTDKNSKGHVIFPNNSVMSLDSETEVEINGDKDNMDVSQILGRTWHRIKALTGEQTYQVKTYTAIAAVRGTKFEVNTKKNNSGQLTSEISLLEGKIDCQQLAIENDKKVSKATKLIEVKDKPQTVTLKDYNVDKSWNQRVTPNTILNDDFAKEMKNIDKVFDVEKDKPEGKLHIENVLKVKGVSTTSNEPIEAGATNNLLNKLTPTLPKLRITTPTPILKLTVKEEPDKENPKITGGSREFKSSLNGGILYVNDPGSEIRYKFSFEDNRQMDNAKFILQETRTRSSKTISECKGYDNKKEECTLKWTPGQDSIDKSYILVVRLKDKAGNEDDAYKESFILKKKLPQPYPTLIPSIGSTQLQGNAKIELYIDEPVQNGVENSDQTPKYFVKFRLNKISTNDIYFTYRISGTAKNGEDYNLYDGVSVIYKGDLGVDIPLSLLDDNEVESDETIYVTPEKAYELEDDSIEIKIKENSQFNFTIKDNDSPSIIKINARGISSNNLDPQMTLYLNDVENPITSFDILKENRVYTLGLNNHKLKNGDKLYFVFDNDTRDSSLFPFTTTGQQDRRIILDYIFVDSRKFEFTPLIRSDFLTNSKSYIDGQQNRVIYDRANKDTFNLDSLYYVIGDSFANFGNFFDGEGVLRYGDQLSNFSDTPLYFDRTLEWNGSLIITVDWL